MRRNTELERLRAAQPACKPSSTSHQSQAVQPAAAPRQRPRLALV